MGLTQQQVNDYFEQGVVIVPDLFTEADLQPLIACIDGIVDERARALHAVGKITDLCEDQGFEQRFASLHMQCPEIGNSFDIMQLRPRPLFDFLFNKNLLDAMELLVGPEISCNPIQHLRPKLPLSATGGVLNGFQNVPWHQDAAVTWEEADPTEIVTCWLPLVDANEETGCMQVAPGIHKAGYLEHQAEGGTTIKPHLVEGLKPVTAECPKGGAVLMSKYTPHLGLTNRSNKVRWTLDLRYQPVGEPTGRPFHPEMIVRSRRDPASVQDSYDDWCRRWEEALVNGRGYSGHRTVPMEKRIPASAG